jgi:hypothetical protein
MIFRVYDQKGILSQSEDWYFADWSASFGKCSVALWELVYEHFCNLQPEARVSSSKESAREFSAVAHSITLNAVISKVSSSIWEFHWQFNSDPQMSWIGWNECFDGSERYPFLRGRGSEGSRMWFSFSDKFLLLLDVGSEYQYNISVG